MANNWNEKLAKNHFVLRNYICDWIDDNPNFVLADGELFITFLNFFDCRNMRNSGVWVEHVVVQAAVLCFKIDLHFISDVGLGNAGDFWTTIQEPSSIAHIPPLTLGHYAERHWVSIRKRNTRHLPIYREPPINGEIMVFFAPWEDILVDGVKKIGYYKGIVCSNVRQLSVSVNFNFNNNFAKKY